MIKTKVTPRQKNDGPTIFVTRPQTGPNIRGLRAGGKPWKTKLTDTIAKSDQIQTVNRTKRMRTEKPKFKIKKLLPEPKTVQIKKDGQTVKTINVNRKSYYFDELKQDDISHRFFVFFILIKIL